MKESEGQFVAIWIVGLLYPIPLATTLLVSFLRQFDGIPDVVAKVPMYVFVYVVWVSLRYCDKYNDLPDLLDLFKEKITFWSKVPGHVVKFFCSLTTPEKA